MISSSPYHKTRGANRKVRKLLGRAYLRENRIAEALEVYLGILKDYPDEADVLIILGNLYGLAGSPAIAERLYRRVLQRNPGDSLAEKQAARAHADGPTGWETDDALSTGSIGSLLAQLSQMNAPDQLEAIRGAAELLEQIPTEDRQVDPDSQLPEDLQQLLPALVALNIRQARAAGYPDLAEALQSLQINLTRQVDDRWADDLLKENQPIAPDD